MSRPPSDEVSDLIQHHVNYFAELEDGAEAVWRRAGLSLANIYEGLVRYLQDVEGVEVRIETVGAMRGALRRFDPERRVLTLSEALRRGSRNFQVAHQLGLLTQRAVLDRIARESVVTPEAEGMTRVALANYFAAALLMPYQPFLEAARSERYDIEVLGHRFRTSFEQVCHRLTTLRRPGAEGVGFHFVRIDVAGNISKRFSAAGFRFALLSGAVSVSSAHIFLFCFFSREERRPHGRSAGQTSGWGLNALEPRRCRPAAFALRASACQRHLSAISP